MSEITLDLCNELTTQLQRLEVKPENVARIQQLDHFKTAIGQEPRVQRTYLTLALSNVLANGPEVVPQEIRLGLNMGIEVNDWLEDIKLIVIPFIKANEDKLLG